MTVRGQSPGAEPQAGGRTPAHHASRILPATFVRGHFSRCPLAAGLHQPWGHKDVWRHPRAAGASGGSVGAEQPTHLASLPSWHPSHLLVVSGLRGPILTPRALTRCWWGPGSPEHRTDAGALTWFHPGPPDTIGGGVGTPPSSQVCRRLNQVASGGQGPMPWQGQPRQLAIG